MVVVRVAVPEARGLQPESSMFPLVGIYLDHPVLLPKQVRTGLEMDSVLLVVAVAHSSSNVLHRDGIASRLFQSSFLDRHHEHSQSPASGEGTAGHSCQLVVRHSDRIRLDVPTAELAVSSLDPYGHPPIYFSAYHERPSSPRTSVCDRGLYGDHVVRVVCRVAGPYRQDCADRLACLLKVIDYRASSVE